MHQINTNHCRYTYLIQQANKGIYIERTPAETAVERAHLVHTLKHGLAHRPDLAELSHKGVYLEVKWLGRTCSSSRSSLVYLASLLSLVVSKATLSPFSSPSPLPSVLALRSVLPCQVLLWLCRAFARVLVPIPPRPPSSTRTYLCRPLCAILQAFKRTTPVKFVFFLPTGFLFFSVPHISVSAGSPAERPRTSPPRREKLSRRNTVRQACALHAPREGLPRG